MFHDGMTNSAETPGKAWLGEATTSQPKGVLNYMVQTFEQCGAFLPCNHACVMVVVGSTVVGVTVGRKPCRPLEPGGARLLLYMVERKRSSLLP